MTKQGGGGEVGEGGPFRYSKAKRAPGEGVLQISCFFKHETEGWVIATVQPEARITSFSVMKGNNQFSARSID